MKVSIEVSVRSNVKRGMWCNGLVDADSTRIEQEVDAKAQKAAEFQCRKYGDMHNPKECGKQATVALEEIRRAAERASTRPGVKVSSIDEGFGCKAREATKG